MRIKRVALSLVVIAVAAAALLSWVIVPYRCNDVERRVDEATERAWALEGSDEAKIMARDHLAQIDDCRRSQPRNVNVQMIAAANDILLSRWQDAIDAYETALRYDRRPELYVHLAGVQYAAGRHDDALRSTRLAATFSPDVVHSIDEPELRLEAYRTFDRKQMAAGNLVRNRKLIPARRDVTQASRSGLGTTDSPVPGWIIVNQSDATTIVELLPSTRRHGARMLHIRTSARVRRSGGVKREALEDAGAARRGVDLRQPRRGRGRRRRRPRHHGHHPPTRSVGARCRIEHRLPRRPLRDRCLDERRRRFLRR